MSTFKHTSQDTDERPPVVKNGWWFADCPAHGRAVHMDVLESGCGLCQNARIEADNARRAALRGAR